MTLGQLIKRYISDNDLTYEEFADRCKLTKGYISMLVRNVNPSTGKPPIPRVETYMNIAKSMGISLDELFKMIEDSPIQFGDS